MNCPSCGAPHAAGMRFCGMCGTTLVRHASRRERRRVSVVFIDLAAFTTLTHGFDPETLRDLADEVLTVVAGVIEDYDGYVDAFRGDGLIALFGAPHSHPDDPQRAVLAAAAGLRAIETIGRDKGYPLRGRAGVNTGIVIAGSVGSGRVRDYTVMGSAVNLAARLEAAAEPGEVWVGPETYEATRHRLLYELVSGIELAGFPNVTHAYRLTPGIEPQDADPYASVTFVGREREFAELDARLARVRDSGRPHELRLVGEAGSGKTRLLREWARALPDHEALVLWVEARPTEPHSWVPIARQMFDVAAGEEPRVVQGRVAQELQRLLPGQDRWHRYILASLGLSTQKSWTRLERRSFDRTNVAWSDLLAARTRAPGGPRAVVLIVENEPHDPALLEFLALLQRRAAPFLIVRTSRGRSLGAGRDDTSDDAPDTLPLSPLSLDESLQLLDQLATPALKVATQPLLFQVGGVPAYVLELGRALSITQAGSFSGSLASLLQARLDMLPPASRRLLAHAALAGERAWEGLLRVLAEGDEEVDLELLTRERLLIREAVSLVPGEVEYRFQSELLRHAVLRMIPFGDRPLLHLRIASWLEAKAPLALSELIGYHFREGSSHDAAYPHYLAAADLAVAQRDPVAFELFEGLLELELPPDLQAQGTLAYAQAALSLDRPELALDLLERAGRSIEASDEERREEFLEAQRRLRTDAEGLRVELEARERATGR